MYIGLHEKYPLFQQDFNESCRQIFKKHSNDISNFMKIPLGGAELFLVDGRTDRHDEANTRFSQYCERA